MAGRSLNKVLLIGNLGRDAETKHTSTGTSITRFSIATSRKWKDQLSGDWKEEVNWTNISAWQKEKLAQYLTKGTQVFVEGRLQTRSYEDKDGKKVYATEVVADEIILLGGKSENGSGDVSDADETHGSARASRQAAAPRGRGAAASSDGWDTGTTITDDDAPF